MSLASLDTLRVLYVWRLVTVFLVRGLLGLLGEHHGVGHCGVELRLICICVYLVCLFHLECDLRGLWLERVDVDYLFHGNSLCDIVVV